MTWASDCHQNDLISGLPQESAPAKMDRYQQDHHISLLSLKVRRMVIWTSPVHQDLALVHQHPSPLLYQAFPGV